MTDLEGNENVDMTGFIDTETFNSMSVVEDIEMGFMLQLGDAPGRDQKNVYLKLFHHPLGEEGPITETRYGLQPGTAEMILQGICAGHTKTTADASELYETIVGLIRWFENGKPGLDGPNDPTATPTS